MTPLTLALLFYTVIVAIAGLAGTALGSIETFSAFSLLGLAVSNLLYRKYKNKLVV